MDGSATRLNVLTTGTLRPIRIAPSIAVNCHQSGSTWRGYVTIHVTVACDRIPDMVTVVYRAVSVVAGWNAQIGRTSDEIDSTYDDSNARGHESDPCRAGPAV